MPWGNGQACRVRYMPQYTELGRDGWLQNRSAWLPLWSRVLVDRTLNIRVYPMCALQVGQGGGRAEGLQPQ